MDDGSASWPRAAVVLPVLVMALLAGVSVFQIRSLLSALSWLDHSTTVIAEANETERLIIDLETGLRGYLITGDRLFLEPNERAVSQLDKRYSSLRQLVSDNPPQVTRIAEIQTKDAEWRADARETSDIREKGGDFASFERTQRGKLKIDDMRRRFAEFRGVEERLRDARNIAVRRDASRSTVALGALLLSGAVLAVVMSRRQLKLLSTTRKQAETLRASEERFRLLVEQVKDYAIFMLDTEGHIVTWNMGAERLKGYRSEEILGRHFSIFYSEGDAKAGKPLEALRIAIRDGRVEEEEWRVRRDGSGFLADVVITSLHDSKGTLRGFAKVIRDVTEMRQAESVRRSLTQRLGQLVEHSPAPVAMFDKEMRYLAVSRSWLPGHGMPERDIIGMSHYEIFPDLPERWKEIHRRCAAGAVEKCDEDPFPRADGSVDWFRWEIRPWYDETGNVGGFVIYSDNITERRKAKEALREAVNAREAFLSVASHELRNPLSALSMQIGLVLKYLAKTSDVRVMSKLEAAKRQVDRMTRLTNNLLDVSRIMAGRLDLELEDVDLSGLLEEVVARSEDELKESGCLLRTSVDSPAVGRWDRLRLDQVVTNLLSNAMKYGRGKPVEVTVESDETKTRLSVRDHGIGIKPEDQKRIFERFERAAEKQAFVGFGLGLWIVRQIVEAMGGKIEVTSQEGEGSTFTVDLPRSLEARLQVA